MVNNKSKNKHKNHKKKSVDKDLLNVISEFDTMSMSNKPERKQILKLLDQLKTIS